MTLTLCKYAMPNTKFSKQNVLREDEYPFDLGIKALQRVSLTHERITVLMNSQKAGLPVQDPTRQHSRMEWQGVHEELWTDVLLNLKKKRHEIAGIEKWGWIGEECKGGTEVNSIKICYKKFSKIIKH